MIVVFSEMDDSLWDSPELITPPATTPPHKLRKVSTRISKSNVE